MSNFVKYENINSLIQKIADKLRNVGAIMDDAFSDSSTNGVQNKVIKSALDTIDTALSGKSDTGHKHSAADITSGTLAVTRGGTGNTSVDTTPTSGSSKMVTSGGIYTALAGKQDVLTVTSGTAICNSTYVVNASSNFVTWRKYGCIVQVNLGGIVLVSDIPFLGLIASGLPNALRMEWPTVSANRNGQKCGFLQMNTNGTLCADQGIGGHGEGVQQTIYATFYYLAAN